MFRFARCRMTFIPGSHSGASVTRRTSPPAASKQPLRGLDVGGADGLGRMCADVARRRADERTLDVNPADHLAHELVLPMDRGDSRQPGLHPRQLVGHDRRQDAVHAVLAEPCAGTAKIGLRKVVLVEVHAGVAVDLQVEIVEWLGH